MNDLTPTEIAIIVAAAGTLLSGLAAFLGLFKRRN